MIENHEASIQIDMPIEIYDFFELLCNLAEIDIHDFFQSELFNSLVSTLDHYRAVPYLDERADRVLCLLQESFEKNKPELLYPIMVQEKDIQIIKKLAEDHNLYPSQIISKFIQKELSSD
ncbi:MAG: hypothetical protein ACXADY_24000 [Candidatus Hodarchaeales archaeon]|jgi:hypothetical protein